jgi:hypothetical protein
VTHALAQPHLTPEDILVLSRMKTQWERGVDPMYRPAGRDYEIDIFPLRIQAKIVQSENEAHAWKAMWTYASHCPLGTSSFQDALAQLVELSAAIELQAEAQAFAALFVAHWNLCRALIDSPMSAEYLDTPLADVTRDPEWFDFPTTPYTAALKYIRPDYDRSWISILEIAVYSMSSLKSSPFYRKSIDALFEAYKAIGDDQKATMLNQHLAHEANSPTVG